MIAEGKYYIARDRLSNNIFSVYETYSLFMKSKRDEIFTFQATCLSPLFSRLLWHVPLPLYPAIGQHPTTR